MDLLKPGSDAELTTQSEVIEFSERTPDCTERKLSKHFPTIAIPMRRGRDERLFWPLRISRFYVRFLFFFFFFFFDAGVEI